MKPYILNKNEEFVCELPQCTNALVTEERNGMFEVELQYFIYGVGWENLKRGNIIVADANDTLKEQKFRIYNVQRSLGGEITVYGRHISYDLANDMIDGLILEMQSCEYVLNSIFKDSTFCQDFVGWSDIVNMQDYRIGSTYCLNAIMGEKGSILDTFGNGAEILRDNRNFHVLNKRGHDNGVVIKYRTNLTGLDVEEDDTDMITCIKAIATYKDENDEEITINSNPKYVNSEYIDNYETPIIREIDFTDEFEDEEIPTPTKLAELAKRYFQNNKCDIPKQNYRIEFVPLSKCVGYEGLDDRISLCDTVTIQDTRYGIDTKAKVIKTVYDVLRDRYDSMELGEPRNRLGDVIQGSDGKDGQDGKDGKDGSIGPQGKPGEPGKDGKTTYTWIRYADNELGSGMSNLPNGKEYIGFAYNKDTEIESNNPNDYVWSKYVGNQGIPGQPGEDGKTLYTWLKYADDELGNGMSDTPTNKEYIGLAYNKTSATESTNPQDYAWSKIRGDQGIPGKPGIDGKTKYTWVKYADTPTTGMSDSPEGKAYLGLAYNKDVQQESTNYADYVWSKIKGEDGQDGKPGEPGQPGPPGENGNLNDFPDTLPDTPKLSSKLYGLSNIELNWTYDVKIYYQYELYASRTKGFTPNVFDLIHAGQSSSFLFQAKANETWYFRVGVVNTHGTRSAFSNEVEVTTQKTDAFDEYFSTLAVGKLVTDIFSTNYMEAGMIKANWIELKGASVIRGDGSKTLYIDSVGNMDLDVNSLKIRNKTVLTGDEVTSKIDSSVSAAKKDIEDAMEIIQEDLQVQIDGKIETWNQVQDPSTAWTTAELKLAHMGDIWYNTQFTFRWTGSAWEKLEDKDAKDAQKMAESKRRVFTATPTVPYDKGDMWVQGTSGDIMVCTIPKTTGQTYSSADWSKASKYTDDAKAIAAQKAADTAKGIADQAKTSADASNTKIAEMSNDNKLTSTEKQSAKKEWDVIVGEKPKIVGQADKLSITTEKTAYETKYNELNTYLTPLLANLSETSDIVGTTYRSKFKGYYDARQDLLNAISTKLKENADSIQVGGRNLLLGSDKYFESTTHMSSMAIGTLGKPEYVLGRSIMVSCEFDVEGLQQGQRVGYEISFKFTDDTIFYCGCWMKYDRDGSDFKGRMAFQFDIPNKEISEMGGSACHVQGTVTKCKLGRPMIEIGTRASDWREAPEDIEDNFNDQILGVHETISKISSDNLVEAERIFQEALLEYVTTGSYEESYKLLSTRLDQTSERFDFIFNKVEGEITDSIDGLKQTNSELISYISFDEGSIILGNNNSPFKVKITNEKIQFLDGGNEVAYISNQKLFITDAHVTRSLQIGSFKWLPRDNGNTSFTWIG